MYQFVAEIHAVVAKMVEGEDEAVGGVEHYHGRGIVVAVELDLQRADALVEHARARVDASPCRQRDDKREQYVQQPAYHSIGVWPC